MRKSLLLIIFLFGCSVAANAQATRQQAREAEWKSYALPQTNFARQVTPDKELLFRVPADWKRQGTELIFDGPHSASIIVQISRIPDGYPFQQYFASILKSVRDLPGAADETIVRKTQLQDFEARELYLDLPNEEGEMRRRVLWSTVVGPLAIAFHFQAPTAHVAETEPYFKAVVQSVIFISPDYPAFEKLRASAIKTPAPGPVHELESIVASLNEATPNRESAVMRLSALFSSHADVAIDLLLDARPLVRAAAVQALARTNNDALKPFLWEMVDDDELLVAEAAARSVGNDPDVVAKTMEHSRGGVITATIARVWPFMTKEKRNELLQRIFSQTAVRPTPTPTPSNTPSKTRNEVKVRVSELTPVKPGLPIEDVIVTDSANPRVQMGALTLLSTVPPDEFKLPLARIMASNYDALIAVALEVASYRGESLPLDSLLKLTAFPNQRVNLLAAQSLGLSAAVADIPRIEALISKDSSGAKKSLDEELKTTIKKIRFRQELSGAKSQTESREIISRALSDSSLADFAWRYDCEATVSGCTPTISALRNDFAVKPFAENLFPKKVRHYTAIPNPGQAVQKLHESLNGLQLDSPRAQANLVLMMGAIRQNLLRSVSAPIDAETVMEFTGIDGNSPIALTSWTAEGALDRTKSAERKAIVLRVNDRARFERMIEQLQEFSGNFTDLTDYVAVSTRAIAAVPAILPVALQASQSTDPSKPASSKPVLKYAFSAEKEWNGLRIKTIEHRWVNSDWSVDSGVTHLAFVGDTAILTRDLASLRDLLSNVNNKADRQLAENPSFRKAVELKGDIVYFSDFQSVMAELAVATKSDDFRISESGALNIGSASWENTHHLLFAESDWAKPLLPFHPQELSAPRELLPASTIAYYMMKVDAAGLWLSQLRKALVETGLPAAAKLWSIDFEKEVLPELGPECGAVLLELPNIDFEGGTWVAFCKLKSNKLADALSAGKLFAGVGPAKDSVAVKVQNSSYFVGTRNGYLIVSNDAKGIAACDGKSSLATTRDYSRAVEKTANGIVAFGGYNLEAAIAAANRTPLEGVQAQIAGVISSVASAFHSQSFYATATAGTVEAHSSVSMDREGRYPIADFSLLPKGTNITFVTLEPKGVPIIDQKRLSSLAVKFRAKAPGPIDNIRDDIKTADQAVEQKSATELLVTVNARRGDADKSIGLPIKDPAFAEFLKPTAEIASDNKDVIEQARKIAGNDRDAWSVARKLADWTYQNLEWKLVSSASVEDTLATREADCSEFSQLFVAMARSLGLPSRMVSGLAYSGNSFGGHAWVEVWVGKWIELDPTWGTHFVDATHIRNNSNTLTTSAALNLVELEVLEAKRAVSDFQKSAKALTLHLLDAIPLGGRSDIEAAFDLPVLTDEFMGQGTWAKMNEAERELMWSAYRRLLSEIVSAYGGDGSVEDKLRLLHVEEKENEANLTCLAAPSNLFLKLRLVRRNEVWYLVEIVQADPAFRSVYETLQPAIATIEKTRSGQKAGPTGLTDYSRVLMLLGKDAGKAIAIADESLKVKANNPGLRYLKAIALFELDKADEAEKLLRELAAENFATAIYKLAAVLSDSEDQNRLAESIKLYERYTALEPHDPRAFHDLAIAYDDDDNVIQAEAALRKVVELNPAASDGYVELAVFLTLHGQLAKVAPVLTASDKNTDIDDDLFGTAVRQLYIEEEPRLAEKFAASEPARLKKSPLANVILGRIHFDEGRYPAALKLLNFAAQLDKTYAWPYIVMAQVHRKQLRWNAALKASDQAISLDKNDSEGHYQRACALARLGRLQEAISALEKAIELDPAQAGFAAEEADLKPLGALPAFKKLLPEPEKP